MATDVSSIGAGDWRRRMTSIIGGSAGNLVEWYDWYAYSVLTIYFAPRFFPDGDATAQLLGAAAIFAVGFLMRPIGAYVMGVYADRQGRKAGLTLSVGLMCAGSLMIAFAPTYERVGALAPAILLVARMIQGLSVGGEYGASSTYLSEMATRASRGFWSSFQYVTLIGGQLLALAVLLLLQGLLSEAQLTSWGWRIPFVIGAALALAVFLLRRGLAETASFDSQSADRPRSTVGNLWRDHRRTFLIVMIVSGGTSGAFYAFTTYMQKFLVNTSGFEKQTATEIMTAALVVFMLLQPAWGALSDRIGRRPLLLIAGIGSMLAAVPIFTALSATRDPIVALGLVLVPLTLLAAYNSIAAVFKAELFPAHIRALGVSLPYALGNAALGGTAEYVALWFKSAGIESAFYWYIAAILALATAGFLMLPETRTSSLIAED